MCGGGTGVGDRDDRRRIEIYTALSNTGRRQTRSHRFKPVKADVPDCGCHSLGVCLCERKRMHWFCFLLRSGSGSGLGSGRPEAKL